LRLMVSNGTNSDETVVYFNENASNGFDRYDSPKMFNSNTAIPEIYTQIGTDKLVINGMNAVPFDTELPLGFYAGAEGAYSLKANELLNLENVQIILKDGSSEFDLTSGTAYEFSSAVVNNTSRFSLIFRTSGSSNGLIKTIDNSIMVYSNTKGIVVKVNDESLIGSEVMVYNALGQRIVSKQLNASTVQIDNSFIPDVYLVKVNSITKKVVIK